MKRQRISHKVITILCIAIHGISSVNQSLVFDLLPFLGSQHPTETVTHEHRSIVSCVTESQPGDASTKISYKITC